MIATSECLLSDDTCSISLSEKETLFSTERSLKNQTVTIFTLDIRTSYHLTVLILIFELPDELQTE